MSNKYQWRTLTSEEEKTSFKSRFLKILNTNRSWFLLGFFLFGLLTAYNIWIQKATLEDWNALFFLIGLYVLANYFYRKFKNVKSLILSFIFPLALAILVLIFGTIGFYKNNSGIPLSNHFYSAANLITLNSSEFKDLCPAPNVYMRVARLIGGFLAGYAFLLAFSLAVGKENISKLFFRFFRIWNSHKNKPGKWFWGNNEFYVIIGDGTKALDLAYDLLDHESYFVFLDTSQDDYISNALEDASCWYFKGKAFSRKDLKTTYFWEAKKVFVMNENDEINFRSIHEIDELLVENAEYTPQLNVHFEDQKLRESVHTLLERRSSILNAFSIAENTATRLLKDHPIDRFTESTKIAQVVIVGFNKQAQEIILACARLGHYLKEYSLAIHIFNSVNNKTAVEQFLQNFPMLDKKNYSVNFKDRKDRAVLKYTFQGIDITFCDMPQSESLLRSPDFKFYDLLQPSKASTVYVCLDDGMQNTQFLDTVLPRLGYLKSQAQRDIQVFSFYNYPDKKEQEYIETKLNSLASHIPVFCFGNMLDECSVLKIENEENLDLAKRIAFIYHCLYNTLTAIDTKAFDEFNQLRSEFYSLPTDPIENYGIKKKEILEKFFVLINTKENFEGYAEKHWKRLKQIDRESNMQAANHARVKLRQIGKNPDLNLPITLSQKELNDLSELEHRRWNAEKLLMGWMPYINPTEWKTSKADLRAQKFHNYLVTFEQLPEYEKSKDWVQVMGVTQSK
jgi:hypothetical protein